MIAMLPPGASTLCILARNSDTASWVRRCSRKFETHTPSKYPCGRSASKMSETITLVSGACVPSS